VTTGRSFSADEIARLLKSQVGGDDESFELKAGLRAVHMAAHSGLVFQIEREGQTPHFLRDADAAELAEISGILWNRLGTQFVGQGDDDLTPDALNDEPDAGDPLIPDALRDVPDPLEGTPEGLTPDSLRDIIADPGLARRLATGMATVDDLLTPNELKGQDE
jgi:hypothetical protein